MEGDRRVVEVAGLLGCQNCLEPYLVYELKVVEGANRRFFFKCPKCNLGIRVIASLAASVEVIGKIGTEPG